MPDGRRLVPADMNVLISPLPAGSELCGTDGRRIRSGRVYVGRFADTVASVGSVDADCMMLGDLVAVGLIAAEAYDRRRSAPSSLTRARAACAGPAAGGRPYAVSPPGHAAARIRASRLPGLRWHRIEPELTGDPDLAPFRSGHDLFGDGSLVLLATPGHTPGSMSLLVRRPGLPPLIMVGDLTYDAHLLEAGHVPGVGSRRRLRETTAMINTLRQQYPGLVILPAHDPGAASRLAQATGQAPRMATA
jgi:hypothetical protein